MQVAHLGNPSALKTNMNFVQHYYNIVYYIILYCITLHYIILYDIIVYTTHIEYVKLISMHI